jgi:histidinol-phosphate aminotransferase
MNINSLVRKNILELDPYTSARQFHLEGILLDANENPLGSVIDLTKADDELALNRYPDPYHRELRNKLAVYLKIKRENLFIGVGSDEIIDLAIRIFCEPGKDSVMIMEPTYGMYKVACDINNVATVSLQLTDDFQINQSDVEESFRSDTKLVFVCSPNNPTANLISKDSILALSENYNCVVVVDEAYIDFAERETLIYEAAELPNLIVMRTISKVWGLAGVRCGYCAASEEIINFFYKIKLPYNLNKLTASVIIKALDNFGMKEYFKQEIILQRDYLAKSLREMNGIKRVYPSDTNFILFEVENPGLVHQSLVDKGIIIRNRSNQVKNCLRVTVGTKEENQKFLDELEKIL